MIVQMYNVRENTHMKNNIEQFIDNYMSFTNSLFHKIDLSKNVMISPLSMYMVFAFLLSSSEGKTKDEIMHVIMRNYQMEHKEFIDSLIKIADDVCKPARSRCSIANTLITKEEFVNAFNRDQVKEFKKIFGMEMFAGKNIEDLINHWCDKKTHHMIPEIIYDASDFDFALVNAIAFAGIWEKKYKLEDIDEDGIFTNSEGIKEQVTMMESTEHEYIKDEDVIGAVKPYRGDAFDFMAVLPRDDDMSLEALLQTDIIERMHTLYEHREQTKVITRIPEYQFSYDIELKEHLQKAGMRTIFTDAADMSKLVNIPAHVDDILHKTCIKVDRNGTKAAAITASFQTFGACCHDDDLIVELDRPFIFSIMHKYTGIPVFTGIVNTIGVPFVEDKEDYFLLA